MLEHEAQRLRSEEVDLARAIEANPTRAELTALQQAIAEEEEATRPARPLIAERDRLKAELAELQPWFDEAQAVRAAIAERPTLEAELARLEAL